MKCFILNREEQKPQMKHEQCTIKSISSEHLCQHNGYNYNYTIIEVFHGLIKDKHPMPLEAHHFLLCWNISDFTCLHIERAMKAFYVSLLFLSALACASAESIEDDTFGKFVYKML